jgi:hypothetical protein
MEVGRKGGRETPYRGANENIRMSGCKKRKIGVRAQEGALRVKLDWQARHLNSFLLVTSMATYEVHNHPLSPDSSTEW